MDVECCKCGDNFTDLEFKKNGEGENVCPKCGNPEWVFLEDEWQH